MSCIAMSAFEFHTCPSLINEPGGIARLGEICDRLSIKRVLVVTDAGIVGAGLLDSAIGPLEQSGIAVEVFDKVVADPPAAMIQEAVALGTVGGVDGVVGFGGGSAMDTAKLVALLALSGEALEDVYGVDMVKGARLPLVLIPTTAGTGSEVTPISIVTRPDSVKQGVVSAKLIPDVALLDAKLTVGLPAHVSASTGIDAMVHAIEAFTSAHKKNPYSDMLAKQALELLGANLLAVIESPENLDARQAMLFGAALAGQAFANAPVGAVHALAYPLGGQFHVSHGLSNALVLSHVLRFNAPEASAYYAELAPCVLGEDCPQGDDRTLTAALIDHLEGLYRRSGLPQRLSDIDIPESALEALAEDGMQQQRLLVNNPREVTYPDALAIYRAAY